VYEHTRAAWHHAASRRKPVNWEIEAFRGARIRANGSHVYSKLVTDGHIHYLFGHHKEQYLIDYQCELAASVDDSGDDQSPEQSGLPMTSKKRRRGRKGSTRSGAKTKKNVRNWFSGICFLYTCSISGSFGRFYWVISRHVFGPFSQLLV